MLHLLIIASAILTITGYTSLAQDECPMQLSSRTSAVPTKTATWTENPAQTWTAIPTGAPANVVYSYVSLYASTPYKYYLLNSINDFLNVSSSPYYGTIDVICPWGADSTGNYTCIATFSNATQANETIYGGTQGYLPYVFNAWYPADGPTQTSTGSAPTQPWTDSTTQTSTTVAPSLFFEASVQSEPNASVTTLTAYIRAYNGTISSIVSNVDWTITAYVLFASESSRSVFVTAVNDHQIAGAASASIVIAPTTGGDQGTKSYTGIIVGVVVGVTVLLGAVAGIVIYVRRQKATLEYNDFGMNERSVALPVTEDS